jgi:hypothetical protein
MFIIIRSSLTVDNKKNIILDLILTNIIGKLQTFTLKWSVIPQPMPLNVNRNEF